MLCSICGFKNATDVTTCASCGAPLTGSAPLPNLLALGTKLFDGTYTIGKVLGQGGFGITYLGSDVRLNRPVAVKEFFPAGCVRQSNTVVPASGWTVATFTEAKQRFLQEGQILARFNHPSNVRGFAVFEENNTAYMAMEYLGRRSLATVLQERGGRLSEREAVGYIQKAGEALSVIHQAGLLHRDIKPENIMVTDNGRVVLVDFGTAKEYAAGRTQTHSVMLTPGYAPLEQYAQRAHRGAFTDVYALAATLYHLLTGQVPVAATDRAAGVMLPEVLQLNPSVSKTIAAAVKHGLVMEVGKRPQSVQAFLDILTGKTAPQFSVTPTPDLSTLTPPVEPSAGQERINPVDGAVMVYIPSGEFIMGSNEFDDAKPQRHVYLDGYWIYKFPVTVAQYRKFCNATGRRMPPTPSWDGRDNHPIVNVTWHDVMAYAQWAKMRLPTEAEWEKAARGTDGRRYPWGNEWDSNRCVNMWGNRLFSTKPVGSYSQGASPYSVIEMAGNIWEWCSDWYDAFYYGAAPLKNPPGPNSGRYRVLRGGSWLDGQEGFFCCAFRFWLHPEGHYINCGFRCATRGTP